MHMDKSQARRENLRALRDSRFHARLIDLAKALKRSDGQVSQWLQGQRSIREDSADHIEKMLKLTPGTLSMPGYYSRLAAGEESSLYGSNPTSDTLMDIAIRRLQRLGLEERAAIYQIIAMTPEGRTKAPEALTQIAKLYEMARKGESGGE